MSTVFNWSASWVSGGFNHDLYPGETHVWTAGLFRPTDVVSATAFPIIGNPNVTRTLAVRNLRTEGKADGLRVHYDVVNIGNSPVPGYFVNLAAIND